MTSKDATVLKGYFNTGDTPTESNFADLIDSVLPGDSDATDIQGSINALSGDGVLYLPAGTYALGGTGLTLNGEIEIVGAGIKATTITYTGSGSAITINSGTGVGTFNWGLRNLRFDGVNNTGAIGATVGQGDTSPYSANQGYMTNVMFSYFDTAGTILYKTQNNHFFNCFWWQNGGDGLQIELWGTDTGGNTHTNFHGCHFRQNTNRGVYITNAASIIGFNSCMFELNGQEGAYLLKETANAVVYGVHFRDSYWESNNDGRGSGDYGQLSIHNTAGGGIWQDILVDNCHFSSPGTGNWNIYITQCEMEIRYPYSPGAKVGSDSGSSVARARIVSNNAPDDADGWTLGGNNSPAIWEERAHNAPVIIWENDGASSWTEYIPLTSYGAATSITDGGTIAHGLGATPTAAICTPSVAGEMVSVTALDGTNITVAIKQDDGTAGTSQTIYWRAYG